MKTQSQFDKGLLTKQSMNEPSVGHQKQATLVSNPFTQSQYDTINKGTAGAPLSHVDNAYHDSRQIHQYEGYDFSLSQDIQRKNQNDYFRDQQLAQNALQIGLVNQSKTSDGPYESNYQSYRNQSIQYIGQVPQDSMHSYVNTTQSFDQNMQSKSQSQMMPHSILHFTGQASTTPQMPTMDRSQENLTNNCQTLPHPLSLVGTANTSQLQMAHKVTHISNKYNVELKPSNQQMFDDKHKIQGTIKTSRQTPSVSSKTVGTVSQSRGGFQQNQQQIAKKQSVTAQSVHDIKRMGSKGRKSIRSSRSQVSQHNVKSQERVNKVSSEAPRGDARSRSRNRQWHGRKQAGAKTVKTTQQSHQSMAMHKSYLKNDEKRLQKKQKNSASKSRSKSRDNSIQRSIRAFIGLGASSNNGGSIPQAPAVYEQNKLESTGKTSIAIEQQIKNATLGLRQGKSKINSLGISRIGTTGNTTKESASLKQFMGINKANPENHCSKASLTTVGMSQKTSRTLKKSQSRGRARTRSNSRKGSSGVKDKRMGKKSVTKKEMQTRLRHASEYHRQVIVRRHFCIWIEAYIKMLKYQKQASHENAYHHASYGGSLENALQRSITPQKQNYTNRDASASKSPISQSRLSARSQKSRKSVISAYSNSKANVNGSRHAQILFKDASKSSVPISQGFFDNVASPNSNCAAQLSAFPQKGIITVTEPHQPHSTSICPQDAGILLESSQALSVNQNINTSNNSRVHNLNTSSNIMLNSKIQKKPNTNKNSQKDLSQVGFNSLGVNKNNFDDEQLEKQRKGKQHNLESMKNIISHDSMNFYNDGLNTHVNCFARVRGQQDQGGGLNVEDLQTRNVMSTISGKAEFRETAQLGQKISKAVNQYKDINIFDQQSEFNSVPSQNNAQSKKPKQSISNLKKGVDILLKVDNKILNRLLGDKTKVRSSTIKRTSRSNSMNRGKTISRSRSKKQTKHSSKQRSSNSLNGPHKVQSSQSQTISSKSKSKQISRSKMDPLNIHSKFSGSLSNVSYIRTISGLQSVDKSMSELRALNARTLGPKTISPYKSRSRSKSNKSYVSESRSRSKTPTKSVRSIPKSGYYQSTLEGGQQTITSHDVCRLLKLKHFLKWVQFIREEERPKSYQSVRFDITSHRSHRQRSSSKKRSSSKVSRTQSRYSKNEIKGYWGINLKRKVFYGMLDLTLKQKRLNDIGYQILQQQRTFMISQTFLVWIEKFNSKQIERKKLFFASSHWVRKTTEKVFRAWAESYQTQARFRFQVRQVVPMRCLLRILNQNSNQPPQQMFANQEIGSELFQCTQMYEMKRVNSQHLVDSINVFKFSLVRSIFLKMKQNYFNLCRFKGNIAINLARNVIQTWHYIAHRKVENRNKSEQFHCNTVILRYKKVLNSWSYIVKRKKTLAVNENSFVSGKTRHKIKKVFEQIRQYACQQNVKSLMNYRASKMEERRVKKMCVRQFKVYTAYRQEKQRASQIAREKFLSHFKSSVFKGLATTCKKLSLNEVKRAQVDKIHCQNVKITTLKQWHINCIQFKRARLHHESQVLLHSFHSLREGILIKQINAQKKLKAQRLRHKNLKIDLLWFLKEYHYEQNWKRELRAQRIDTVAEMRKRRLLYCIKDFARFQVKVRTKKGQLDNERIYKTKQIVIDTLKWNVSWQAQIYELEQANTLKFKSQAFDYLKYSTKKQKILREALIETLVKRNEQRAKIFLDIWRETAYLRQYQKASLKYKTQQFQVLRVIKKLKSFRQLKQDQREIIQLAHGHRNLKLKELAWSALYTRHTSKKVQNSIKAHKFSRRNLLEPSFNALKKRWASRANFKQLKYSKQRETMKRALDHWVSTTQSINKFKGSGLFRQQSLLKKGFESLVKNRFLIRQDEIFEDKSMQHYEQTTLKKYFDKMKNFGPISKRYHQIKTEKYSLAKLHFVKSLLTQWRLATLKRIKNQQIATTLELKTQKSLEQKLMRILIQTFKEKKNTKIASTLSHRSLKKRVFTYLKKQACKNTILNNLLRQFTEQKDQAMKKQAYQLIKETRAVMKKLKVLTGKAFGHLESQLYSKVFVGLSQNAKMRKRLRGLYEKQKQISQEKQKRRVVSEIVDCFGIQPKLDAIAHQYFIRKNLRSFKKKVLYIKGRNEGSNLHEFEIKAFEALGINLMRKAFSGLRMHAQCSQLKKQEKFMADQFYQRRWFNLWRQNYLTKAQNNYFLPFMQQQMQKQVMSSSISPSQVRSDVDRASRHHVLSHRSQLPPRYIQNFSQMKEKVNYDEREEHGFSPKSYQGNVGSKQQYMDLQQRSQSKTQSQVYNHPNIIHASSKEASASGQYPPRNKVEFSQNNQIQEDQSLNNNIDQNYNNFQSMEDHQLSQQTDQPQKPMTANFQTRRVSNIRSERKDSRTSSKELSMAEKAQMLSSKIKQRIAHSRDSRNALSNEDSKSRSRERSNGQQHPPSGIASIRQGITLQNSVINSPRSDPQIVQKDYNTFGNNQRTNQIGGKLESPERNIYNCESQQSQSVSPNKSLNRSQPRQKLLQQSASPKKRGVSQSPDINSEARLQKEFNEVFQSQTLEMHEISNHLKELLAKSGQQFNQTNHNQFRQEQYLAGGMSKGTDNQTKSFKNFLNEKQKFSHLVDSAGKSQLTPSDGKSGDGDQLKLSNQSGEKSQFSPNQFIHQN